MGSSVWSREYIQAILDRADPISAVYGIADIWSSRQGRLESDPCFGLLPCEYNVHLFLNYHGDVGNGGHAQFFMNPVGDYANETLGALTELGLQEIHGILFRATAVFPGSRVPKEREERNKLIEGFPEAVFSLWGGLDRELYAIDWACWQPILMYLRAHESEIMSRECD